MSTNVDILDDQKLYRLCKLYGEQAKKWRYKFMGLLPEVYRRKLYEKKGFDSVFEFAKKLAGLSEEHVRTALNLDKSFTDRPILRNMLVNGEVSINKLVRITSVATKENEEFWANQVRILPNRVLETLVKDERIHQKELLHPKIENKNSNNFPKPLFDYSQLHVQLVEKENFITLNQAKTRIKSDSELQLSDEVKQKLLELQQKEIDINQFILEMLQKRELEIAQEKERISSQLSTATSRYIPAQIKNILHKEYGTKCSIKTCPKRAEQIHHTQRFSLSHLHDPQYMAPFCKNHHIIAHSIDVKFQQKRRTG